MLQSDRRDFLREVGGGMLAVLVGYGARFQGLTLSELTVAMLIAAAVMSLYCIGSANAGAATGQTHSVMARSIFGTIGSGLVSLLLVVNGMAFYLFTVKFIIDIAGGLMTLPAVGSITTLPAGVLFLQPFFCFRGGERLFPFLGPPVDLVGGVFFPPLAFTHIFM